MLKNVLILCFLSTLTLTGCVKNNREAGALFGGLAGGFLGSSLSDSDNKTLGTAFGAIVGSIIGAQIGEKMDLEDKAKHERAFQKATHSSVGENITWSNVKSGNHGQVSVIGSGKDSSGHQCKKVKQVIVIDNETYEKTTTVCRIEKKWSIVE